MPNNGDAPQITDSEEKLIHVMLANRADINGGYYPIAKAFLDIKSHKEEAKQTRGLKIATAVLAFATIALVFMTAALVFATLYPKEQKPTFIIREVPQVKK